MMRLMLLLLNGPPWLVRRPMAFRRSTMEEEDSPAAYCSKIYRTASAPVGSMM